MTLSKNLFRPFIMLALCAVEIYIGASATTEMIDILHESINQNPLNASAYKELASLYMQGNDVVHSLFFHEFGSLLSEEVTSTAACQHLPAGLQAANFFDETCSLTDLYAKVKWMIPLHIRNNKSFLADKLYFLDMLRNGDGLSLNPGSTVSSTEQETINLTPDESNLIIVVNEATNLQLEDHKRGQFISGGHYFAIADNLKHIYAAAEPFPHVFIDNLFPEELLTAVANEFPRHSLNDSVYPPWNAFKAPPFEINKLHLFDEVWMGENSKKLFSHLKSSTFVRFLQTLTGIGDLIPDPHYDGAGLHQTKSGGVLKVHADFNRGSLNLWRRVNVFVYLNEGWDFDKWGGHLDLWDAAMTRRVQHIAPVFNRLVVFSSSRTSFHGHPDPLATPEHVTRKSLAMYYYTQQCGPGDRPSDPRVSTLFKPRPGLDLFDSWQFT